MMSSVVSSTAHMNTNAPRSVPAVEEVWHWVVDTEGGSVEVSADLHVVAGHETHGRHVLFVKHLPL